MAPKHLKRVRQGLARDFAALDLGPLTAPPGWRPWPSHVWYATLARQATWAPRSWKGI